MKRASRLLFKRSVCSKRQRSGSSVRMFPIGELQGYHSRVSTTHQHNPHLTTQQPGPLFTSPQTHSSATVMQQYQLATDAGQDHFVISSDHNPLDDMEIHGMIGSNEARGFDGEPACDNNSNGGEEKDDGCDGVYGIHWYGNPEEFKREYKDRQPDLTVTELDPYHTHLEVINIHVADFDGLEPYRLESSAWITHANHPALATFPPETRSSATKAFQTTPSQTAAINRAETMANHTSPYSSSSSQPIPYRWSIHGIRQAKDIAAVLEEREKQIINEGIILEQQYAELRQKLIAHAEGFMEVRRKLADLQAKALSRAERVKKVDGLREELRLLDSELYPD
ncbi:hypothetical protein BDV11DRAFT_135923 [Aspergillus similis]